MLDVIGFCDTLLKEGRAEEVLPLGIAEMVAFGAVLGDTRMLYWTWLVSMNVEVAVRKMGAYMS